MTASQQGPVTHRKSGRVLIVQVENPPVNALNTAVRKGLAAALAEAASDADIAAVLLAGAGKNFIAGADIREFGQPPQEPTLPAVCAVIEESPKLVVAAVQGAVLGGGLEVAMSAHYRLALTSARLGLPEVTLGLLPGAGGTQRAPRLIGVPAALDLILSGKPIAAARAHELGLVDRLAEGDDPVAAGLAYVQELLAAGTAPRRTRDRTPANDAAAAQALDAARAQLATKYRGLYSPAKIIDAVAATLTQPFDHGLQQERAAFLACVDTPQRKALVHAFFAPRAAAHVPGLEGVQPRPLRRVGVVGGGTMGAGITVALLDAGFPVTMVERDAPSLERGRANVQRVYDHLVARGRLTAATQAERMARFEGSTDYAALATSDLVIEAVFEDLKVKQAVFAALEKVCPAGAVLASNTSYLDINALGAGTGRPQDVIGLHFFSPANVMKLLEIVPTERGAADVTATAFALARRLKKVAVRAGVCDGFIGNRMLAVYRRAAEYLLMDGASPYEIDAAVRDFGFPMGPFQVVDLAGGDISWAQRKRQAPTRDPRQRYVPIGDRLCERGWFGQKTRRGWYLYPEGSRHGVEDPEVLAIVAAERQAAGVTPRHFDRTEIQRRYFSAMINEGANILRDGIALRPSDIDVVLLNGYAFPRYRGGPMFYADQIGLERVLADLQALAAEDAYFWQPSPLLVDLVARGENFQTLNSKNQPGAHHA